MEKTLEQAKKDKAKKAAMIKIGVLMSVGFIIDVGQAIIVYNAGKGAEAKALGQKYKWSFPGKKELLQTAGLVLVTSLLTGFLVSGVESMLLGKDKDQITV